MRSGAMVAQLMATKALAARRERAWISRAATSLPEPAGPVIRTRLLVGAILSIRARSCAMAEDCADQLAVVAGLELQFLHFALQPRRFQRALHHMQQPVGLERLFDEVVGALLDRGDRGLDGAMAGDHHHRQIGLLALDGVQHLNAVQPASLAARCRARRAADGARAPPPSAASLSPATRVS